VRDLDVLDPKGWTYCYHCGPHEPIDKSFYDAFADNILGLLPKECNIMQSAWAPAGAVDAAAFLLDKTTSFVSNLRTAEITSTKSTDSAEGEPSVLVDPILAGPDATSAQRTSPTSHSSATVTKLISSSPPGLASLTRQDESKSEPENPLEPTSLDDPLSSTEVSNAATHDVSESNRPGSHALSASTSHITQQPSDATTTRTSQEASATSDAKLSSKDSSSRIRSSVRLDLLNSVIQEIGQLKSASDATAVDSTVGVSMSDGSQSSESVASPSSPGPLAIGSTSITANSEGLYMIGTHTLQSTGVPYEHQGVTYSLDASHDALVVNGVSTYAIHSSQDKKTLPEAITFQGATATLNSDSEYVVETQTLKPGGPAITISGTQVSLASNAAAVIVGSKTESQRLTSSIYTSDGAVVIGGVSTHAISPSQDSNSLPQAITFEGATATLNSKSEYIVESQTLKLGGPAITIAGTQVSLASDAAAVIVGSETSVLSKTMRIGDYLWAGIADVVSADMSSSNSDLTSSAHATGSTTVDSAATVTRTASDGQIVTDDISATDSDNSDPINTSGTSAGEASAKPQRSQVVSAPMFGSGGLIGCKAF
jgi:uncharacterized protein YodC (DUF2158 family)